MRIFYQGIEFYINFYLYLARQVDLGQRVLVVVIPCPIPKKLNTGFVSETLCFAIYLLILSTNFL